MAIIRRCSAKHVWETWSNQARVKNTSGWNWQSPESVAYDVETTQGTSMNSCSKWDCGMCVMYGVEGHEETKCG